MGDVFIWNIFYEAVILPFVFQRARDKAKIAAAVNEQMPNIMACLEKIAPAGGFIFGELSIADLAIAIPFSNLKWARVEPDVSRWPGACVWVERTLATTALAKLTRIAEKLVQTPPHLHRKALVDLAVPLTDATIAGDKPRSSIMLSGM
jgi:glutathione S-transferase